MLTGTNFFSRRRVFGNWSCRKHEPLYSDLRSIILIWNRWIALPVTKSSLGAQQILQWALNRRTASTKEIWWTIASSASTTSLTSVRLFSSISFAVMGISEPIFQADEKRTWADREVFLQLRMRQFRQFWRDLPKISKSGCWLCVLARRHPT